MIWFSFSQVCHVNSGRVQVKNRLSRKMASNKKIGDMEAMIGFENIKTITQVDTKHKN